MLSRPKVALIVVRIHPNTIDPPAVIIGLEINSFPLNKSWGRDLPERILDSRCALCEREEINSSQRGRNDRAQLETSTDSRLDSQVINGKT